MATSSSFDPETSTDHVSVRIGQGLLISTVLNTNSYHFSLNNIRLEYLV